MAEDNTKSPLLRMILLGIVRHAVGILGGWMLQHNWIDAPTHQALTSDSVLWSVMGAILMLAAIGWSALQKTQAWHWVVTALRLNSATPPADVPAVANSKPI